MPMLREFPPKKNFFVMVVAVALETTIMPLLDGGKSLTIYAFVKIQYQSVMDGRTDLP